MSIDTEAPEQTKPTGAALIRAAAQAIRDDIAVDGDEPNEDDRVVLEVFDAATEAFPIDGTEPARNPKDRRLVLAVLALADLAWTDICERRDTDA